MSFNSSGVLETTPSSLQEDVASISLLQDLSLSLINSVYGHLLRRANSIHKNLMLRNIEAKEKGRQRMGRLDNITDS